MEKKINSELLLMGFITVILTWLITSFMFYQSFENKIKYDLKTATDAMSVFYNKNNNFDNLSDYEFGKYRVTVIDFDGKVSYDSHKDSKEFDNHKDRPEFLSALKYGEGSDIRDSKNCNTKTYYYAKKLDDNSVIRMSVSLERISSNYKTILLISSVLLLFILLFSYLISKKLTRQIMKPIFKMGRNIDKIYDDVPYKELKPFVNAIKHHQIKRIENEKIRREFTANVSHELKTPLTSISGYAEIIENGLAKEEDIKEFASKIHSEAGRLLNLIGDIIRLSDLEDPSKKNIKFTELVDLYEIAEKLKEFLQFSADKNDIAINIIGSSPFYVKGDKTLLNELIFNLCDNAIKYNKHGGSVYIVLFSKDGKKVVSVKDNGIGIDKSEHERVFERFYRVDKSRSKETGGTGLGLGIVKHISIKHNANIEFFSEIDKGTEINIIFNE